MATLAAIFATYLWDLTGGRIPQEATYFGTDADRVVRNLLDPLSSFHRLNVHPLFGLICIAFQNIFAGASSIARPLQLLAAFNGAVFAIAIYSCARIWGSARLTAASAVLLGMGSGGFIYWVAVPETHLLAGLTVLGVFMLARRTVRDPVAQVFNSALMFALGYALTVTNAAAWLFAQIRYEGLRPGRTAGFLSDNLRQAPQQALAALAGLGLIAIGMAVTWYGLYNRLMGRLLDIFREGKFVTTDAVEPAGALNALGVAGFDMPLSWAVNLGAAALLVACAWRLRNGPVFIPVFGLFGLLLHSVYARHEAFLFSPNYVPAFAVSLALALGTFAPRGAAVVIAAVGLALGVANIAAYQHRQAIAAPTGQPLASYGLVQPRPASLPPLPPGILRTPN